MIEERDVICHCDSRVLRRARNIARADNAVYGRTCTYGTTPAKGARLKARVAEGDGRQACDVAISIDEEASKVVSYECTCKESLAESGMCKHVAATALAFVSSPSSFKGYAPGRAVSSSEGVQKLLRATRQRDRVQDATGSGEGGEGKTPQPSGVSISVVLVCQERGWSARFKVVSGSVRYAIRDLGAFARDMGEGSVGSYGGTFSFPHVPAAFTEGSARIARFVERCVDVRKELEEDRSSTLFVRPKELKGELSLSTPELVELLDLCDGTELYVEDVHEMGHAPRRAKIVRGNPPVRVVFEAKDDGGFSYVPEGHIAIARFGETMYVWYQHVFYRCDENYDECEDFLRDACSEAGVPQYLSAEDAPEFCRDVLPSLERNMEVIVPGAMRSMAPCPCRIEAYLDYAGGAATCIAQACYGEESLDLFSYASARSGALLRDERAEKRARAVFLRWFTLAAPSKSAPERPRLVASGEERLGNLLSEGLEELRGVADVYTTPSFDSLVSRRSVHATVGVSLKSGLIDLSVASDSLSPKELSQVLSSYHRRMRYHRLADGTFLDLRKQDLDDVDRLLSELDLDASSLEAGETLLSPYRAFQLDDLLDDSCKDDSFKDYVRAAAGAEAREHVLPEHLASIMRPYQVDGFRWLNSLADAGLGGILADEMGLGKSIQLISFLSERYGSSSIAEASIIVCPASLVYNWLAEFDKFAPELDVRIVAGTKEERLDVLESVVRDTSGTPPEDGVVVITSYDLLKHDVDEYMRMRFFCAALDEAQYIKNAGTKASRCAKTLTARHRFALTGTPIENRLSELWSIFDFLMPGFLGSYRQFRDRFELPIRDGDERAMGELKRRTEHFILRRMKGDVLDDLPAKNVSIVYSHMGEEQETLYRALEQNLRDSLRGAQKRHLDANRIEVLSELTRLRETCCDPRLVYSDYQGGSAKLATVVDLVSTARDSGAKCLVFSQFTRFLDLIASELDERGVSYYTITGATPKKRRIELADAFNADNTPAFLVSLKAGGTGLNLTGASVVIHADPWWNAAAENQATDRSHRIGQKREVMVYKVIAKGTIEERVVKLQEAKGELAERFIDGSAESASLSNDDLLSLLES